MPYRFIQSASFAAGGTPTSSLSVTFASAQAAGNLIVAVFTLLPGNTVVSVTDTTGNTYSSAASQSDTAGLSRDVHVYYAFNIGAAAAGANVLTVTVGSSNTKQDLIAAEWNGVQSVSVNPLDANGSATGTSGPPSCNVTTTAAAELVVGVSVSINGQTGVGAGWTKRVQTSDNVIMLDRLVSAPSTVSPNTTPSDTDWCIAGASFQSVPYDTMAAFPDLVDV